MGMTNDQLQRWAQLAEILGGLAVLVTLIFIGLEIRSNTAVNRATSYAELLYEINEWAMTTRSNPDQMADILALSDYQSGSLSPEDFRKMNQTMSSLWRVYDTAYYYYRYGLLGEAEWQRFASSMCTSGAQNPDVWEDMYRPRISVEFANFLEDHCK